MNGLAIIPAGQESQIQVSEEAREAARQAAAALEGVKVAYVYLCNADAKVVTDRKEAQAGDFVVIGARDRSVNLGKTPMFIVLSQHVRHAHYVKENNRNKLVWDVARDALTAEQAAIVKNDWKSAKPYDSYMLLHVSNEGLDPHRLGPVSFKSSAHTCDASQTWLQSLSGKAKVGVAPFSSIWELKGVLEDTGYGAQKYTFQIRYVGCVGPNDPAYKKLAESWQAEAGAKARAKATTFTGGVSEDDVVVEDDHYGAMADEQRGKVTLEKTPPADASDDYATELPPAEMPKLPQEALDAGIDYSTPMFCGRDGQQQPIKKAIEHMNFFEAANAYDEANRYINDPKYTKRASGAVAMLQAYANASGWDVEKFGLPPF
jgi:hypothetical protein